MSIGLAALAAKLRHYHPELHLCSDTPLSLRSVLLPEASRPPAEPDSLYIMNTSALPEICLSGKALTVLCLRDIPLPAGYREHPRLNLLLIDPPAVLEDLYNELQDIFYHARLIEQRSLALFDILAQGKGLQAIIDAGFKMLQNPIGLLDASFALLAGTKGVQVDDPVWNSVNTKGFSSYNFINDPKIKRGMEAYGMSRVCSAPFIGNTDRMKHRFIHSAIFIENRIVAYLSVIEAMNPFDEDQDLETVSLLCQALSCEMQKNHFFQKTKGYIYECFIADLLEGRLTDTMVIEERIKLFDWNMSENFQLLLIDIRKFDTAQFSLLKLRDQADLLINNALSVIYDDSIVLIMSHQHKSALSDASAGTLKTLLKDYRIPGGVSTAFHDLKELRRAYLQTLKTIDLGIHLNKDDTLFFYDDYVPFHFLNTIAHEVNLNDFCHPALFSLISYDRENHTNYTQTLYIYVMQVKNLAESAKALYIHVNTLLYRLHKIEEIAALDVRNPEVLFQLYQSFKILEFQNDDYKEMSANGYEHELDPACP